jgi:hypothetical protein
MVFLSAQPDHPYFHWQVEVMVLNFMQAGINPNHIEVVFASHGGESKAGRLFANAYPFVRVFFYENTIPDSGGYASLCRPHVLAKHFAKWPQLEREAIFYHDSDILFRKLPDFARLLQDERCHLSDTVSYIGAEYIQSKGPDILGRMAEIVGIDPQVAVRNQKSSGGAQYLLKGIDVAYWRKVERDSLALYKYFCEREAAERKTLRPEQLATYNPIQKWCADMWAVLWSLWARGRETALAPELSFSWPTQPARDWEQHNIFHNAGVTEPLKATHFYKGEYINRDPFQADLDYVRPEHCSWRYAQAIRYAAKERKKYRDAAAARAR